MSAITSDFVIVGGGLAGLLSARELRAAGASVVIVEQGPVGRQASWAGGGILSPLYPWRYAPAVNALVQPSQAMWPLLCEELRAATGIDPQYRKCGMLVLDADAINPGLAWATDAGAEVHTYDAAAVGGVAPAVAVPERQALWMPQIAQVRNPRLLAALRADVECAGVRIIEQEPVTAVLVEHERVNGVTTAAQRYAARHVVVTSGAWSGEVLRSAGVSLPVRPVRGQMVLLRTRPDLLETMVLFQGHYLVPRRDGRVLVGSTMEETGFDCVTTNDARTHLLDFARQVVPALADAPCEQHWAGLRPGSPEGIPFIGAVPGVTGLYVNTGQFRNGVVMAPASARLLANLILGRPPLVDPQPYRAGR